MPGCSFLGRKPDQSAFFRSQFSDFGTHRAFEIGFYAFPVRQIKIGFDLGMVGIKDKIVTGGEDGGRRRKVVEEGVWSLKSGFQIR